MRWVVGGGGHDRDHVLFAFAMINETYGGRELLRVMAGTPAERCVIPAASRSLPPRLTV